MAEELIARIPKRLRCFTGPSTESDIEGLVEPGAYMVIEHRQDFPDSDTDYTRLALDRYARLAASHWGWAYLYRRRTSPTDGSLVDP